LEREVEVVDIASGDSRDSRDVGFLEIDFISNKVAY
jgi:hypothetical protein